jgi:hypothetical protein
MMMGGMIVFILIGLKKVVVILIGMFRMMIDSGSEHSKKDQY